MATLVSCLKGKMEIYTHHDVDWAHVTTFRFAWILLVNLQCVDLLSRREVSYDFKIHKQQWLNIGSLEFKGILF